MNHEIKQKKSIMLSGQCMSMTGKQSFDPQDSQLWNRVRTGSTFFTLDICFSLLMEGDEHGHVVQDCHTQAGHPAIKVCYCIEYVLGGELGMQFKKAGLVFAQHLTWEHHYAQLYTCAEVLKETFAKWGAVIAYQGYQNAQGEEQHVDPAEKMQLKYTTDISPPLIQEEIQTQQMAEVVELPNQETKPADKS